MKRRGFTLVELLAVIIILAIIALVATPIIMNLIENSKKGAASRSAENYIKKIATIAVNEMKYGNILEGTYYINEDGHLCPTPEVRDCKELISISMNGKKPRSGKIVIKDAQVSQAGTYVNIDNYVVVYENERLKARTWALTEDKDLNGEADIGDLITIGTESFYVYNTDGNEIKALAQYNLNVGNECLGTWTEKPMKNTTGLQDSKMLGYTGKKDEYGNLLPWYGTAEFSNSSSIYADSTIKKHVDEYNSKLKKLGADNITTRLITLNELRELGYTLDWQVQNNIPKNEQFVFSTSYWTETTYGSDVIGVITYKMLENQKYTADNILGVRPVVIIPTSEI